MKLLKYERLLIERLENPNMRKSKERLGSGKTCCCLGHAGMVQECSWKEEGLDLDDIPKFDYTKIRFRDSQGKISLEKITNKGWDLLYNYRKDKNCSLKEFKKRIGVDLFFVVLNDGDNNIKPIPHKYIAQFMRENKRASFAID